MAHYGTLRTTDYATAEDDDIRGASVYGKDDDKLGKIDDVIFDHTSGHITYVVIDTGGWLKTKRFIVPANRLSESAQHEHDYMVDLSKQQIEKFPIYQEEDVESEENWGLYEDRYRDSWSEGSVLHREGSNRTITPPPAQVSAPGTGSGESPEEQTADLVAANSPDDRVFPASGDEFERNPNSGAVGSRWNNFEQQLQQRRREATANCTTCKKDSQRDATTTERLRPTGT